MPAKLPPITNEELQLVLLLVCIDVDDVTMDAWTLEQRAAAEKWAVRTHLRASDNIVRVPPKPDFLPTETPYAGMRP